MVFLAFDVFFMIFCIAMACIIFLLLFCCFPILATVAYAMTIGDGASENDIRSLPKYLYRPQNTVGAFQNEKKQEIDLTAVEGNNISMQELVLHPEDSVSIFYLPFVFVQSLNAYTQQPIKIKQIFLFLCLESLLHSL